MDNPDELTDESGACRALGGGATPISRASFWRGIKEGRYPKPIKVGPNTNRWRVSKLRETIMRAEEAA